MGPLLLLPLAGLWISGPLAFQHATTGVRIDLHRATACPLQRVGDRWTATSLCWASTFTHGCRKARSKYPNIFPYYAHQTRVYKFGSTTLSVDIRGYQRQPACQQQQQHRQSPHAHAAQLPPIWPMRAMHTPCAKAVGRGPRQNPANDPFPHYAAALLHCWRRRDLVLSLPAHSQGVCHRTSYRAGASCVKRFPFSSPLHLSTRAHPLEDGREMARYRSTCCRQCSTEAIQREPSSRLVILGRKQNVHLPHPLVGRRYNIPWHLPCVPVPAFSVPSYRVHRWFTTESTDVDETCCALPPGVAAAHMAAPLPVYQVC